MNDRATILSASAASCLKTCPVKYRNAYKLGIRRIEEPEARRMGTNWHEGLDCISMNAEQPCPNCSKLSQPDSMCYRCNGTGFVDDPEAAVVRMLNHRYETLYPGMSKESREAERTVLLYSLFAYSNHYHDAKVKVVAREIPFRIPMIDPRTRRALPNVYIDGQIDKLVLSDGRMAVMEHKSTSDSVDPSSDYWGHLRLDTQTAIYTYAACRLQADGLLEPYKIRSEDEPISSIIYDVWHKPQIKPKKLSQAETNEFLETSKYFGQEFEIHMPEGEVSSVFVDGQPAGVEQLKKGFAIRETPDMFGARLFSDMGERPDFYFARRPLFRSPDDLEKFEWELFNLYQTIEAMSDNDSWYHNEFSCDNYGRCDYAPFCFTGQKLDPANPPAGFKCIFDKKG
jgi:PD-(D/E)XK nuclease superfamily